MPTGYKQVITHNFNIIAPLSTACIYSLKRSFGRLEFLILKKTMMLMSQSETYLD